MGKRLSKEFSTIKELLQVCFISPTLFKIYMNKVLKKWVQHCGRMGIKMSDKKLIHLLFADDQVIMTQNKKDQNK